MDLYVLARVVDKVITEIHEMHQIYQNNQCALLALI